MLPLPPVVFEDASLLVFDKPAGLAVGSRKVRTTAAEPTLADAVAEVHGPAVRLVCPVDDEASGLVLWAKDKTALDFLSGQFQSRSVERVQLALAVVTADGETDCGGVGPARRGEDGRLPPTGRIAFALGPDLHRPGRLHVYRKRGGRPAATSYRVQEDFGRYTWIECRPETHRLQQVRAHLAAIGAPVLGDPLYGLPDERLLLSRLKRGYKGREDERPLLGGLALHESRLELRHPVTREPWRVETVLPKSLEVALRNLRKFARR